MKKPSWQDEFDKLWFKYFAETEDGKNYNLIDDKEFKAFIAKTIKEEKEKLFEDVKKHIKYFPSLPFGTKTTLSRYLETIKEEVLKE